MNESPAPLGATTTENVNEGNSTNGKLPNSIMTTEESIHAETFFVETLVDSYQQQQLTDRQHLPQVYNNKSLTDADPKLSQDSYSLLNPRNDIRNQNTGQNIAQYSTNQLLQRQNQKQITSNYQKGKESLKKTSQQQLRNELITNTYFPPAQSDAALHQQNYTFYGTLPDTKLFNQEVQDRAYSNAELYSNPKPITTDTDPKAKKVSKTNQKRDNTGPLSNAIILSKPVKRKKHAKRSRLLYTTIQDDAITLVKNVPLVFRRYIHAVISPVPIGITILYNLYCKAMNDIEYPHDFFSIKADDVYILNGIDGDKYLKCVKNKSLSQQKHLNQSNETMPKQNQNWQVLPQRGVTGDVYLAKPAIVNKGQYHVCGTSDNNVCHCYSRVHRVDLDEFSTFIVNPTWSVGKTYYVHGYGRFSLKKDNPDSTCNPKLLCLIVNVDGHLFAVQDKLVAGLNFFYEIPKDQLNDFPEDEILYDCRSEYQTLNKKLLLDNFDPDTIILRCSSNVFPQLSPDFVSWLGNVSRYDDQSLKKLSERNFSKHSVIDIIPQLSTITSPVVMISPHSHPVPPFCRSQDAEQEQAQTQTQLRSQTQTQPQSQQEVRELPSQLQNIIDEIDSTGTNPKQNQPEQILFTSLDHPVKDNLSSEEQQEFNKAPVIQDSFHEHPDVSSDCFSTASRMEFEDQIIPNDQFEDESISNQKNVMKSFINSLDGVHNCNQEKSNISQSETRSKCDKDNTSSSSLFNELKNHSISTEVSENKIDEIHPEEFESVVNSVDDSNEKLTADTWATDIDNIDETNSAYHEPSQDEISLSAQHQESQIPNSSAKGTNMANTFEYQKDNLKSFSITSLQRKVFSTIQRQHHQQQKLSRIQQRFQKRIQLLIQIKHLRSFVSKIEQQVQEQITQFDNM